MRLPPQFGLPGLAAVMGALLALGMAFGLTPYWQAQAHEAKAQRSAAPARKSSPPPAVPEPSLPDVGELNPRIGELLDRAAQRGVAVVRVQQRMESVGPLQRLRLTMTAQAGYGPLRSFIAQALQEDPGLALGRLHVQRPDEVNRDVQADLQWLMVLPSDGRPPR